MLTAADERALHSFGVLLLCVTHENCAVVKMVRQSGCLLRQTSRVESAVLVQGSDATGERRRRVGILQYIAVILTRLSPKDRTCADHDKTHIVFMNTATRLEQFIKPR